MAVYAEVTFKYPCKEVIRDAYMIVYVTCIYTNLESLDSSDMYCAAIPSFLFADSSLFYYCKCVVIKI